MTSAPQTMSEDSAQQQLSNSNKNKPPEVELNLRPGVQMSPPRATARLEDHRSLHDEVFWAPSVGRSAYLLLRVLRESCESDERKA